MVESDKITVAPNTVLPSTKADGEEMAVSEFVAQVQDHIEAAKEADKIRNETAIPSSGPGNPAPQHKHLIESAQRFNDTLQGKLPAQYGVSSESVMDPMMRKIHNVLKNNGMDTQQQQKAIEQIGLILAGKE